ncbi:25S rRNA [Spathaspora sp. JA1]|nr:25S rRNA [Spathaspora sp. JA1]
MARKKTRIGLLKRPKTITGNSMSVPKSIKPQQARQIIRRFHILQKNRYSIINKLEKTNRNITIDNYKELFKKNRIYQSAFKNFVLPQKYSDNQVYKIDDSLSNDILVSILAQIDSEIEQRGGIEAYQSASTEGQTTKRGGDSSKRLVDWLREEPYSGRLDNVNALEIGCLSPHNVISTCGIFKDIVRIDLNSQDPLIFEQNFMERPLPKNDSEKFNLISCSLVLNFIPSPQERGEMLIRMTKFLKKPTSNSISMLFLVLPLPCITNSRYLDNKRLLEIMNHLGFTQSYYYEAKKVAYWLFEWNGKPIKEKKFPKTNLYSGSSRNNFCISIV